MIKRILLILAVFIFCFSTVACKSKAEKEFDAAMDNYNDAMDDFNDSMKDFNY